MGNMKDIQSDLKAAAEAAFAVGAADAILSAIKPLVGSMRAGDTNPAYVNGVDEMEATADQTYDADDYLRELIDRAHVPDGFALNAAGVHFLTEDGIPVLISSPLIIKALSRSFDGKGWSLVVLVVDPDGNVHELLIPLSEVSGNFTAARRRLIAHGLRLTPGNKSSAALATYMLTATPTQRIRQVDAPGWHGKAYLLGSAAVGDCDGEELRLKDPSMANPLIQTGGSPEGWQMLAALLLGNRRLMFAVCFALSGALLRPTRTESGGVHFFATSTFGKTTTCIVAGSVVGGGGDKGFIGEWNGTDVSQESRFAMANDSAVISDEVGNGEAKDLPKIAYLLANGQGRTRALSDGSLRPTKHWRTVLISGGEMPIGERIREGGGVVRAGMELRIVDIYADAGKDMGIYEDIHGSPSPRAFAKRLTELATNHYGWAMRDFVAGIAACLDEVVAPLKAAQEDFSRRFVPEGSDAQVYRVADRIALAAAAGEIAADMGILPWPEGAAVDAAATCFAAWLKFRGGKEDGNTVRGVTHLLAVLADDGMERFAPWESAPHKETLERDFLGLRRMGADGRWQFHAHPKGFRKLLGEHDYRTIVRALVDRRILLDATSNEPSRNTKVQGCAGEYQQRFYRLCPPPAEDTTGI